MISILLLFLCICKPPLCKQYHSSFIIICLIHPSCIGSRNIFLIAQNISNEFHDVSVCRIELVLIPLLSMIIHQFDLMIGCIGFSTILDPRMLVNTPKTRHVPTSQICLGECHFIANIVIVDDVRNEKPTHFNGNTESAPDSSHVVKLLHDIPSRWSGVIECNNLHCWPFIMQHFYHRIDVMLRKALGANSDGTVVIEEPPLNQFIDPVCFFKYEKIFRLTLLTIEGSVDIQCCNFDVISQINFNSVIFFVDRLSIERGQNVWNLVAHRILRRNITENCFVQFRPLL
mmetsp:Transcript_77/g.86  ORF Transcript_77/g.86 Transcript_77/m.86 type:complete len:287 (-) Transcript_77:134-994(-)